uniref:UBA domain-containing protein n=1 Tax=Plectus sambesii TaxID=2011161 RepID=A0A914XAR3_9BILA
MKISEISTIDKWVNCRKIEEKKIDELPSLVSEHEEGADTTTVPPPRILRRKFSSNQGGSRRFDKVEPSNEPSSSGKRQRSPPETPEKGAAASRKRRRSSPLPAQFSAMDYIGEDNVDTLKAMGFTDDNEVRHALRLAKNDLSEAVSLLTRETSGLDARMTESNNSSVPLPSTSPTDAAQFAASTDTTDDSGPLPDSLEFPTTHLYELESRVLTSSWNVPFGPKESLARCLHAARCLAREKLCEGDDGCNRFMGNVLVEAFNKLLNSAEVQNRWNKETLDGILLMHLSLVAFVVERLAYLPIPINLLKIIAQLFDPNSNYMQKTKLRYFQRDKWEEAFGSTENAYAVPRCDDSTPEYGFLLEVLNEFGSLGGFDRMLSLFNDDEHKIDAQGMYSLLHPLRLSAEFLNREKMKPILKPCVERALAYVNNLEENDLRSSNITSYVVDLIGCVGELGQLLWLSSVEQDELDQARLGFILRLLKSQHFGARMQALKEVSKLLDALVDPKKDRPVISSEKISSWLTDNRVLSVALEGNIDQSQYVDRLKTLLSFLGPRLSCQEVSKIWSLRKGRAAVAVDNVFTILAQAACKFKEPEFDHLIALILKNWSTEETRMKDRILFLLGQVGKETSFVYTHEKVAEVLWTLSHENGLEMPLVISALRAQLGVVNEHSKDGLREIYINKCMEDLTKKKHTMPAMWHLSELLESIK